MHVGCGAPGGLPSSTSHVLHVLCIFCYTHAAGTSRAKNLQATALCFTLLALFAMCMHDAGAAMWPYKQ